jgi:hypothetical protein
MKTDIHALSGIRTHDPSVRAGKDISFLRPCGHCDWHIRTDQIIKHTLINSPNYAAEPWNRSVSNSTIKIINRRKVCP